jgi:ankyrin repeat protein
VLTRNAKQEDGFTALTIAAKKGHDKCTELLLNAGADMEVKMKQEGSTALTLAAHGGHFKCVKLLLKKGANMDAKQIQGSTALILAAHNGRDKCTELLLNAGVDTDAKDARGLTALIAAAGKGHVTCIARLLKAGCDINAVSNLGMSALLNAVQNNQLDCVRALVRGGADTSIQFQGHSLDDIVDMMTTTGTALKAALRLPTSAAVATGDVCALCAKALSAAGRLRCGRCKATYYCSQACQRSDCRLATSRRAARRW